MQNTAVEFQTLVSVGDKVFPESLQGYVILRAIGYVIKKYTLWSEVERNNDEFIPVVRREKVCIRVTADTGVAMNTGNYYELIMLTPEPPDGGIDVKAAIAKFVEDFRYFVNLSRTEPIPPGLVTRVCCCHALAVSEVKDTEFWDCQQDGWIFESDTEERFANPFGA